MNSKKVINIGIVGAGGRSGLSKHLFEKHDNTRLVAIYDPDKKIAEERIGILGQPQAQVCDTYEKVTQHPEVDWVMVFSPNCYHREHIISAFEAGKHVFSEKPLATTIEDCQAIFDAHKKSDRLFATGFVLRYAPLYNKVREILDAGTIGKILSIDANENIDVSHGSYIMKNWRRFNKYSGPHILEKCCHDLDLINWFCGSVPSKVASFGGRDFFTPENDHYMDKYRKEDGTSPFQGWKDPHGEDSPFTSEKDVVDNQVAIMEYRNKIRVMFQATLSNAMPERRMYFSGTDGTMTAELYSGELKLKRINDEAVQTFKLIGGGHAGGDEVIMQELYESMSTGKAPKCSGTEGLESSVTAIALEKAKDQMQVFDLEPVWETLER
jgi:predicted dehydrogenase